MKRLNKINLIVSPLLLLGFVLTAFAWQKSERENDDMRRWLDCVEIEAQMILEEMSQNKDYYEYKEIN